MSIFKVESGLVFTDTFNSIDPRWIPSPSNACNIIDGMMRLDHSDNDTMALFEIPSEVTLLMEASAAYLPTVSGDEGGLIVWKSAIQKLEFVESKDTKTYEYSAWRAFKKGNVWTFYALYNGAWELIDSSVLDASMMGLVLKGAQAEGFVSMYVDKVTLCRGMTVKVSGIPAGYKVALTNPIGSIVKEVIVPDGFTSTEVELPTHPYTGTIRVYDTNDVLKEDTGIVDFVGGDLYMVGTDLTLLKDGVELSTTDFSFLGVMYNNQIEHDFQLRNDTGDIVYDIVVRVAQYRDEFGWEWVDIAPDGGGAPGVYGDSISIGNLNPGEEATFWVKAIREDNRFVFRETRFVLDISHN